MAYRSFAVALALLALSGLSGCGSKSPGKVCTSNGECGAGNYCSNGSCLAGPTLTIDTPAADGACGATSCTGALISATTPAPYVVSGHVADGGPVTLQVTVRAGGVVVAGPTEVTPASGTWQFAWTAPAGVNGTAYTLEAVASDLGGLSVTRSRVILVDNVPPTATFATPTANQLLATPTVAVTGQVGDGSSFGIASAEISADGTTFQPLPLTGVQFSAALPVPAADRQPVTVAVRVTDLVGNVGTSSVGYLADRVGPTLAIAVPAADASCAGPACTGAVVNLAAGSTFTLSGTASDPSGLAAVDGLVGRVLDGAAEVPGTRVALAAGSWSYAWSSLPADAGKAYTFELAAADAAGNTRVATRGLWVDRVAPVVTLNRPDHRLVPRGAVLVTFSEPMAVPAVLAATSFSPAPASLASYGTSDGLAFNFGDPAALSAYAPYSMTVGTGAVDKAGNPIAAAATQKFLTETAPLSGPLPLETDLVSFTPTLPAIALDADGKPHVVYQTSAEPVAGTQPRLAFWDGRGTVYPTNVARRAMTHAGTAWTAGRATDLAVYANPIDAATLALAPGLKAIMLRSPAAASGAYQLEYALSADRTSWVGQDLTGNPTPLAPTNPTMEPTFDDELGFCFRVIGPPPPPSSRMLVNALIAPDPAFDMRSYAVNPVAFTSVSGAANVVFQQQAAATRLTTVAGFDVAYWDHRGTTTVTKDVAGATAVTGQTQLQRSFLGLPGGCTTSNVGSAQMAWATRTGDLINGFLNTLMVSCNADPLGAGAWRTTIQALRSGTGKPGASVTRLASARSTTTFAVAAAVGSGTLAIFKSANDACASAPALVPARATIAGKDPALAVDDAGNVWVAYVSTAALTVGQLFAEKVAF